MSKGFFYWLSSHINKHILTGYLSITPPSLCMAFHIIVNYYHHFFIVPKKIVININCYDYAIISVLNHNTFGLVEGGGHKRMICEAEHLEEEIQPC